MNRIIFATFLIFFASFSSLWAQGSAPVELTVTTIPALATPLSSDAGNVAITYTYGGSATGAKFSITEGATFITATGVAATSGKETTQSFTIAANSTASERQGTIQITADNGTTTQTEDVVIRQSGSGEAHTISVATDVDVAALPSAGGDIIFTVTLGGGATGFTARRTAFTPGTSTALIPVLTSVSGDRVNNTFTVTYGAAIAEKRTAEITIATTGTGSPVETTVDLSQAAGAPEISFTVSEPYSVITNADGDFEVSPPFTLATGDITVTVNYVGTTTSAGTPTKTGDFLTLSSPTGTFPDITQVVTFAQGGAAERTGTLHFTPTDGTNTPTIDLVLKQAGTADAPDFSLTTDVDLSKVLSAAGGDIVATLVLLGNSTSFSAAVETDNDNIITLGTKTATTQAISYSANATGAPREATVRFTISNAGGGTATHDIVIRQEGGDALSVSTDAADLAQIPFSPAGTITATITLTGSATDWSVAKTGDDSHAFIADFGSSTGDATSNTLSINYKANATASSRTATLTFTATGGAGPDGTQVLTLTQLAATPTITIVEGATLTHPLLPSSGSFDVTYTYGGGGTSATSTIVGGGTSFITASGSPVVSATNSKEATQTFSFTENATFSSRKETLRFTATNGTNNVTEDLVITQSGATEPTSISVSTDTDISGVLSASSGTITATITLSGSATGFQVSKSGDADDSFISAFTSNVGDRTDNTLTIEYSRNTRFNERSADLIFRTTGGVGAATTQTLSLRQALSLVLDAVSHAAATHTETFASALAPLGATAFSASIVTNPGDFLTLVTSTADLTSGSPTFGYSVSANTGAEREGEIEITYTDADDDFLALHNIVITQSAQILLATTNADGDAVDVSNLSAESGVITATVTLVGTGTAWTLVKTGDTGNVFTLNKTAGDNATNNTFTITYGANTTTTPRTATITVSVDGTSSSTVLNIRQLGVLSSAISVATNPADLTAPLSSAAGTFTIDLTLETGTTGFTSAVSKGELVAGEGFVSIATATNTITATYTENTSTENRAGEITITPVLSSGTPTPIVISFTQLGVPGIALTLADAVNVDNVPGRLLIGVDVLGAGVRWKVTATTNPSSFLPATPFTVTRGDGFSEDISAGVDGDVLTIVYGGNNGAEREATLTFEALDADGNSFSTPVTQVLTITQAGSPPLILGGVRQTGITPATAHATALPAAAGSSVEFALTLGGGATSYSASKTQGGDFFNINIGSSNTFSVRPKVNTDAEAREGEVTVTTVGGSGEPATAVVSFRQVGTAVGSVSAVSTPNLEEMQYVSVAEGSVSFAISLGGSATGWSAALNPNPGTFLSLGATTGRHGEELVVSYTVNRGGTTERLGTLTLTTTGGTGAGTATFDIEQMRGAGPFFEVFPIGGVFESVSAAAGNFDTRVILHRGAGDFTATESADFITLGAKGGTGQRRTQVIAFTENTGVARTADVTFTSSGGGDAFVLDVRFVQLGAAPTLTATTASTTATDITAIPAAVSGGTGTITGTISLGGGAEGWKAVVEDEGGFFAGVEPLTGDLATTTFVATYNANVGVERVAKIILTSTGRTGTQATRELVFTQNGAAPLITEITAQNTEDGEFPVDFAHATEKLSAEATGTVSATIVLSGGASGFSVAKTGDDSDAFITSVTPASGDRTDNVSIVYTANTGAERSATLTFTTTGGVGTAVEGTLVLTQLAAAPAIAGVATQNKVGSASAVDFAHATEKLAAASTGTILATITLGGSATGWEAAKDGDVGDAFIESVTDNSGTSAVLEIVYKANTNALARSVTINITPTGVGGVKGVAFGLALTQLGTAPTITVGVVEDASNTVIAPVGTTYSIPATAQTLTIPIELTVPAVNVSHVASAGTFFTVAQKTSPLRYEVVFEANTTAVSRDVTLTFEGLDASSNSFGTPLTTAITITQAATAATAPTITVGTVTDDGGSTITPTGTNYSVASTAQTLTIPIELTGTAVNASHTASAGTFFTVAQKTAPLRYEVVFEANTTAVSRDVTLTFEGLDASDASLSPPLTTAITITQAAATGTATITVGTVTDADDTVITPTGTNYEVSFSAQTLTVLIALTAPAVNVSYTASVGSFLTSVTEQLLL